MNDLGHVLWHTDAVMDSAMKRPFTVPRMKSAATDPAFVDEVRAAKMTLGSLPRQVTVSQGGDAGAGRAIRP